MYKITEILFIVATYCLGFSFVPFIFTESQPAALPQHLLLCLYSHRMVLVSSAPYPFFSDCKVSYLWHAAKKPSQKNSDEEVAPFPR